MHGDAASSLTQVLIFLLAAVVVVPIFRRLRASPVLGYLVAGAVIGPFGFAFVSDIESTGSLAEFGVVFLLFIIGLELSVQRLRVMRHLVFGVGSAQMLGTTAVLAIGAHVVGGLMIAPSIVVGGALALSSTAIVLQILSERGELTTQPGRVSFAVLLLQDLAVVPLLLFVALASGTGGSALAMIGQALGRAVLAIAVILLIGRVLLRRVFRIVAGTRSPELFSALSLLVLLGTAWVTAAAGVSMALGAFLAGLLLAETEYRHQVDGDMQPFKGLLLGLFFITVGMKVDARLLLREALPIFGLVGAVLVVKAGVITIVVRAFRLPFATALRSGLLLAQIGEFAFVLFGMSLQKGLITERASQLLMLATAITMAVTPLLAVLSTRIGERLAKAERPASGVMEDESPEVAGHVLIAGFGRIGQTIARLLREQKIEFIALDLDPGRVTSCRNADFPVYYGDSARAEVLEAAGAKTARAVVVTLNDDDQALKTIVSIRHLRPDVKIYARARDQKQSAALIEVGATETVPEVLEASLHLGRRLLLSLGAKPASIDGVIDTLRRENYSALADVIPHSADGVQPDLPYYAAPDESAPPAH